MMARMILCDANILIDVLRLREPVTSAYRALAADEVTISVMTAAELVQGLRNQQELRNLRLILAPLPVLPLSPAGSLHGLELLYQYRLSHGLTIADALIAATALEHGLPLFTLNRKDFRYLPGLTFYEP